MPVDPGTGLTILGGAIGSAKLVEKVLGPTADYLGSGMKTWTENRFENVKRIFERADDLLGEDADPAHRVPPRVLRDVLDDGSFRDDELSAAYYGGILASSRTGVSRDDRGASFTALVGRLTAYQLRAHFVLYQTVQRLFRGQVHNLGVDKDRKKCGVYIPMADYLGAMSLEPGEHPDTLLAHALFGLQTESLIEDHFAYGGAAHLKSIYKTVAEGASGIVYCPSPLGVELYLWAIGTQTASINMILSSTIDVPALEIKECTNAVPTQP